MEDSHIRKDSSGDWLGVNVAMYQAGDHTRCVPSGKIGVIFVNILR